MPGCYKHKKAECKEPCVWVVGKGCKEGDVAPKPKTPTPPKKTTTPKAKTPSKAGKFDVKIFSDCFDKFEYRKAIWKREGPGCIKAMLEHLESLKPGTNVDVKFPECYTFPLHASVQMQAPELVKALLAAGAKPNKGGRDEFKAIHSAAGGDSLEVLKMLIDAGANVNDAGDGETALQLACMGLKPDFVDLLARSGAKLYPDGYSVAMYVIECKKRNVEEEKLDCLKALVKNGLKLDYKMTRRSSKPYTILDKARGPLAEYLKSVAKKA